MERDVFEIAGEQVLAGMLQYPDNIPIWNVSHEWLASVRHKELCKAMNECYTIKGGLDMALLVEYCSDNGILDKVGGICYVADLLKASVLKSLVPDHIKQLKDLAYKQKGVKLVSEVLEKIKAGSGADAVALMSGAIDDMLKLDKEHEVGRLFADDIIDRVKYYAEDVPAKTVSSGYSCIDNLLDGGFAAGSLTILAARPSMGKTSLAMCISENVAKAGGGVLVVSLEMKADNHSDDFIAREMYLTTNGKVSVSGSELRNKSFSQEVIPDLLEGAEKVRATVGQNMSIAGAACNTVEKIKQECIRFRAKHGLALLVVDYLQLLSSTNKKASQYEKVTEISRAMKELAMSLDIPIIALSQLSREVEKRQDKRPTLSDLRESGAIEQDADNVLFLYRSSYYHESVKADRFLSEITEVAADKVRNGQAGNKTALAFKGNVKLFYSGYADYIQKYKQTIESLEHRKEY